MIRVSAGTASVLGLKEARLLVPPRTAYFMCGEHCVRSCAFCSQARSSTSRADMLSRVTWPEFTDEEAMSALGKAYEDGLIHRACIQVVMQHDYLDSTISAIRSLKECASLPVCVSCNSNAEHVDKMFQAGADRISIPLDAASESVYCMAKGPGWQRTLELLETSAERFPGRIGTHLIVGLGESDQQMLERIQWAHDRGILVALFAFTPVNGTPMAKKPPPPEDRYRAIQAARYLIVSGHSKHAEMEYRLGKVRSFGLNWDRAKHLLASGEAFMTSGCPDCNRPYYNERPGGVMYNYPRPLAHEEVSSAVDAVRRWLTCEVRIDDGE